MIFLICPNPYLIQSPASQDDAELVLSHCSFSHFGGISGCGQYGIPMFEEFQPDRPLDFDVQKSTNIGPGCTRNCHNDSYRLNQKLHRSWMKPQVSATASQLSCCKVARKERRKFSAWRWTLTWRPAHLWRGGCMWLSEELALVVSCSCSPILNGMDTVCPHFKTWVRGEIRPFWSFLYFFVLVMLVSHFFPLPVSLYHGFFQPKYRIQYCTSDEQCSKPLLVDDYRLLREVMMVNI